MDISDLDEEIKTYALMYEMMVYKDNVEESPSNKSITELSTMIDYIVNTVGKEDGIIEKIGVREYAKFIIALRECSDKIKPIYLRILMYMEGSNEGDK